MSITHIEPEALRHMDGKEGLILMGCGGDLQEWLDGINDMLTNENILLNGSKFESCSAFQIKELTCLLFPFEGVELMSENLQCGGLHHGSNLAAHGFRILYPIILVDSYRNRNHRNARSRIVR